ncbi:thioredoxin reductase glit [Sarocladium strictum]
MGSLDLDMTPQVYDVLCVGGGPAGLGVAATVARQDFSVLIFDSGHYRLRNERSKHIHGVPGFDHADPAAFRSKLRTDLERYKKTEFRRAQVQTVRKLDSELFEAVDDWGETYLGRKLVLATGVVDVMEDIAGYDEAWGRGIFHCLSCHGYEERGDYSTGVLATANTADVDLIERLAKMAKRFSKTVMVYTNGNKELATDAQKALNSSKILFDTRRIVNIALVDDGPDVVLSFSEGSYKQERFLVNLPRTKQRSSLAVQLGLELGEMGEIKVQEPFSETSVEGCMAVGDAATVHQSATYALFMGSNAGMRLVAYLEDELEANDAL